LQDKLKDCMIAGLQDIAAGLQEKAAALQDMAAG
jgi:hypothetical protein